MFRKIIILINFIVLLPFLSFSEEINLGGAEGWLEISSENTCVIEKPGLSVVTLADLEYQPSSETEILLHFNDHVSNESNLCTISGNNIKISNFEKKKGKGSAIFYGDENFITILPTSQSSFFAGSSKLNDFSIEFWLNPSQLSEGANIIQWSGAIDMDDGEIIHQDILCTITNRNILWNFSNFFISAKQNKTTFQLRSSRSQIPKRWHHHMVRYDSATGLLEYFIDGVTEDIVYTSSTKGEKGEIFYPFTGDAKPSLFFIGRGYIGYLDELRVTSSFAAPQIEKYSSYNGRIKSKVYDLGYYNSRLYYLRADEIKESNTEIYYFYRISNDIFSADLEQPSWNQIMNGELIPTEETGRYLQVMAELYPDGTGKNTPILTSMNIQYEINLPPLPPSYISAKAGDKSVTLSWKPVTDFIVAGYKIYYGDRPGVYFGSDSLSGESPITVGNKLEFTLEGLKNGKLYYFTITSYDNVDESHESIFSREICARPSLIN